MPSWLALRREGEAEPGAIGYDGLTRRRAGSSECLGSRHGSRFQAMSAIEPVAGPSLGVRNGHHGDGVRGCREENHEGEPPDDVAPVRPPRLPDRPSQGSLDNALEGFVDRGKVLRTEAEPLGLVPHRRRGHLDLGLGCNPKEAQPRPRRARIRARTSPHSGATTPRSSAARWRDSSSAAQASSQSASGGPSRLASNSVAMRTRSSSERPRTPCRSLRAEFVTPTSVPHGLTPGDSTSCCTSTRSPSSSGGGGATATRPPRGLPRGVPSNGPRRLATPSTGRGTSRSLPDDRRRRGRQHRAHLHLASSGGGLLRLPHLRSHGVGTTVPPRVSWAAPAPGTE